MKPDSDVEKTAFVWRPSLTAFDWFAPHFSFFAVTPGKQNTVLYHCQCTPILVLAMDTLLFSRSQQKSNGKKKKKAKPESYRIETDLSSRQKNSFAPFISPSLQGYRICSFLSCMFRCQKREKNERGAIQNSSLKSASAKVHPFATSCLWAAKDISHLLPPSISFFLRLLSSTPWHQRKLRLFFCHCLIDCAYVELPRRL